MGSWRGGYMGQFLRVNLDTGSTTIEETPDPTVWLGTRGWSALVGWQEVAPGVGPFDAENRLVFSAGPLVGSGAPTAGRVTVSSIAPRGYPQPSWTSANMGGYFGAELKYAGYDGIIIQGRANVPCYLLIEDDHVALVEARELWGQGTHTTQLSLKARHSPQHQIVTIGPAGENRVRFASIIHRLANAAGNGGFGGVMGAKNLKAIVVRGTRGVAIANPTAFSQAVEYVWNLAKGGIGGVGQIEQGYPVVACSHACTIKCGTRIERVPGQFPTGSPMRMVKCQNGALVRGSHPAYAGRSVHGEQLSIPRPPGLGAVGLDLGNVIEELGLTAWFYDTWYRYLGGLQEWGIRELGGEPIELDNPTWWYTWMRRVAYREGLGDDMAEGLARFYDKHHLGPAHLAEFIESAGSRGHGWHRDGRAMEPHPSPFWEHAALLYAVSTRDVTPSTHDFFFLNREYGYPPTPRAADEISPPLQRLARLLYGSERAVWPGDEYIEQVTVCHQHRAIIKDSLGLCDFVFPVLRRTLATQAALAAAQADPGDALMGDPDAEALLYRAVTGLDLDTAELESPLAERIVNLERCVDIRNHGRNRALDEAVISHFQWPEKTDGTRLSADATEFRALLERFYELRGWDTHTGVPTAERLRQLGLDSAADWCAQVSEQSIGQGVA